MAVTRRSPALQPPRRQPPASQPGTGRLTGSDLTGADLSEAVLKNALLANAILATADLTGADLDSARGWDALVSVSYLNISTVRHPPPGFTAWALSRGAVNGDVPALGENIAPSFSQEWRSG